MRHFHYHLTGFYGIDSVPFTSRQAAENKLREFRRNGLASESETVIAVDATETCGASSVCEERIRHAKTS